MILIGRKKILTSYNPYIANRRWLTFRPLLIRIDPSKLSILPETYLRQMRSTSSSTRLSPSITIGLIVGARLEAESSMQR